MKKILISILLIAAISCTDQGLTERKIDPRFEKEINDQEAARIGIYCDRYSFTHYVVGGVSRPYGDVIEFQIRNQGGNIYHRIPTYEHHLKFVNYGINELEVRYGPTFSSVIPLHPGQSRSFSPNVFSNTCVDCPDCPYDVVNSWYFKVNKLMGAGTSGVSVGLTTDAPNTITSGASFVFY